MALGQVKFFTQFKVDLGKEIHNLDTHVFRAGLITDAVTPAENDPAPHWGGTGTTNYASSQVTPGGNYSSGGPTLSNVSYSDDGGVIHWRGSKIAIAQNPSNPTNARWIILYNNTDSNKRAVAFIDLGSVRDITASPLEFRFSSVDGVGTIGTLSSPA